MQLQNSEINLDETGKLNFQKKAYNDYVQKLRSMKENKRFLKKQLSKEEQSIREQTNQSNIILENIKQESFKMERASTIESFRSSYSQTQTF